MNQAFIRADASVQLGTGHVMRCLTLAQDLVKRGMEVFFITRELPGNLAGLIREKGFTALLLPGPDLGPGVNYLEWLKVSYWRQDAAETKRLILRHTAAEDQCLLVVDHYALDARWEVVLRSVATQIMVIDDLADRPHDCDLLLDQNFYTDLKGRYRGLVPDHCQLLLGPEHALLRPEFYQAKQGLRRRDGVVRRILVFFGGSDPTNETVKALEALQRLGRPAIQVDVVVGSANPRRDQVKQLCATLPAVQFYCQIDNMAELMVQADLAIGAGGAVTWERCFLGLPAVVIAVADNQVVTVEELAKTGAIRYLGWQAEVTPERLAQVVAELLDDPARLVQMSRRGLGLFAGGEG